ncbi:Hsp70 family protein [Paenibacillus cymbidii]|uniref:Hsp70 family protein n=1 Tax=Paenibacillus cymbidii TaxID=1639034 RepID=UPI001F309755|nr:Hsp70 family protein [Paenibacillus cymbidii]
MEKEARFRPIVGIDLGTTNSAVAYIRNGKPEIIASPRGERIIPSVVLIDPQGKVVVGEDARASLVAMPDRTIAAVKRKMGAEERIPLGGQELLPQEISATILRELKRYVDALYGEGEKEAVITVPAYFTDEQRRATKEAGELAGFVTERIINEPTAAALAFGLANMEEDRHLLVYDLGGGTFDVSIVEMIGGLLEVKASHGNRFLGGEDFDWKLVDWFAERMIAENGVDPREDIRAKALLKQEAERVKKELSAAETVQVSLPLVTVKDNRPIGLQAEVTRSVFLELIEPFLAETMASVDRVIADAELTPQAIDEVLLVGGSTRIPRVGELIRERFGKAPRADIDPDEAVALGAAVQAGLKSGALADSGLVATDVAPFSMGIAVMKEREYGTSMRPGGFSAIIPRNTTIPVTRTERYSTTVPGQQAVSIEIYQGEHEWVRHNHRLGEFLLDGVPANSKHQEAIDVTFRYNLNGILEVTALCVSTGKEMTVTVQDALNRNSPEELAESAERLNRLWQDAADEDDESADDAFDFDDEEELDEVPEDWFDGLSAPESEEDADGEEEPGVLQEEAQRLRERANELAQTLPDAAGRERAAAIVQALGEALADSDAIEALEEAVNQATDDLIELEF